MLPAGMILGLALPASGENASPSVQSGEIARVQHILKEAAQAARAIKDTSRRDSILRAIGETQAKVGDFPSARQTADSVQDEGDRRVVLRVIAAAQIKQGDMTGAVKTVAGDVDALIFIAHSELKAGNVDRAEQIAAVLQTQFGKDSILAGIAKAQLDAGDLHGATQTAEAIQSRTFETKVLKRIAISQVEAGDTQAALQTAARLDRYDKAAILREIAAALAKKGNVAEALYIAVTNQITSQHYPELSSRQLAFIQLFGKPEEVAAIREEMASLTAQRQLLDRAAAQASAGDVRGALRSISVIKGTPQQKHAVESIERELARFLESIAIGRVRAGDIPGAREIVTFMREDRSESSVMGEVAIAQAKAGDITGAVRTVTAIHDDIPRNQALQAITRHQAETGDLDGAVQTASAIRNTKIRAIAILKDVAQVQLDAGDLVGALQTTIPLPNSDTKGRILRSIAVAHAREGDIGTALKIAASIRDVRWYRHRPQAFRDIAVVQVEAGDVSGALKKTVPLQEEMWKPYTLRHIAAAQARRGDVGGARRWVANRTSPAEKALALLGLAEGILECLSAAQAQSDW
ncbi:MAG: tetratricopeptide repeat protein [Dehalococcoidia bacterium]